MSNITTVSDPTPRKLAAGIASVGKSYNADPSRIMRRPGFNTRFVFSEIDELALSIKTELLRDPSEGGLMMPLRVKRIKGNTDFDFELVDGDRRLTAIEQLLKAGVTFPEGVAIKMVDPKQDDITSTLQMITTNTGKPLLPLEEAAAYKRLRVEGQMSIADICKAVGRTDVHVRETLQLLESEVEVQDAVKAGKVSGSMAKMIATIAKDNPALQKDLVAEAAEAKSDKGAKGKAAKARLMQKIDKKRAERNVAKGKDVKFRMLTADQLKALGEKVTRHMMVVAKQNSLADFETPDAQAAFRDFVAKDDALAAAFMFGAYQALLAFSGVETNLEI